MLSWQNIAHSAGYSILVDGTKKADVKTNFFDLKSLADFEFSITPNNVHEIKVVPVLANNSTGVGQTTKENLLKVKKLGLTEIVCDGENVTWAANENASVYSIKLTGDGVNLVSSTNQTSLSMANYDAGLYVIEVVSVAKVEPDADGVYYLSSKAAVKNFGKYATLNASIENYVLNIENLGAGVVKLDFDNDEFDTTANGTGLAVTGVDLSQHKFEAGSHSITLTRLGNLDYVNSDSFSVEFAQLEKIDEMSIANGVVSVVRSGLNNNAVIKLITTGGSLVNGIEVANTGYVYNTEYPQRENYLAAGEYVTKVYVEGDGSSTFSYRENGALVACAEVGFEVLKAPNAEILNTAESKLTIEEIENAEYFDVYKVEADHNEFNRSIETNEFTFILDEGSVAYCMKSIGDGETYLTSAMSAPVTITRIETPQLQYNNATNVIRKTTVANAIDYVFAHNGEVKPYNFTSEFTEFADEITGNVFTLYAVANRGGEGQYYLNSNIYSLPLTEISNNVAISLNGLSNNMQILPTGHAEKFNLVVEFDFGGAKQTLSTKVDLETGNEVLSNGLEGVNEVVLNYTYSAGCYIVELLDENHNAIIEDMNNEFAVRVRFVKPSTGLDTLINSEFSEFETLNLNRIDGTTSISVNTRNQIVLSPTNHNQEFALVCVVMISDSFGYILESNGESQLVCNKAVQVAGGVETIVEYADSFTINYQYQAGKYYIDILDENHVLTLPDVLMANGATVSIKVKYSFANFGLGSDLDSEYCESKTISIQPIASISRDGQNLKINNIKETYTYLNYSLLINNYPIQLDSTAVSVDGFIVFNLEYIYQKTPVAHIQEINTVEVVVKNNETTNENPVVASKGGKILIKKTETVELTSYKFNDNEDGKQNNSLAVTFNTYETDYEKKYIVEIQHNGKKVFDRHYLDSDAEDGVVEFRLDDIAELAAVQGRINVFVYVLASGAIDVDGATVQIFNSSNSNMLNINKISAPTNLRVSNSTLTFDSVANAVGYEIYEQIGNTYNKLNGVLITTNSYDISGMAGGKTLVVKAISVVNGCTNSSYSEPINVSKLAQPTMTVEKGKFKIKFDMSLVGLYLNSNIRIIPEISNGAVGSSTIDIYNTNNQEIVFNLADLSLTAEPYLFLAYNNASLQVETLNLVVKVEQKEAIEGVYYLNTDPITMNCYGLFAPTNVKKTAKSNDLVELISWTENSKNVINETSLSVGYVFKIEYSGSGTPYYSYDEDLKYFDESSQTYKSYSSVITGTSAIFPAGYGLNEDGSLKIEFGSGSYKVSVQSIPLSNMAGYNLLSSKFSESCDFEIMTAPVLTVIEGKVSWNTKEKAEYYNISIYDQDGTTPLLVENKFKGTEYDFTNQLLNSYVGVYKVVVKAISIREDTLNSADSDALYVYRIPQAQAVSIDDGNLILNATPFFTSVEVELVDVDNTKSYVITIQNTAFESNLNSLNIENWETFSLNNLVNHPVKFAINDEGGLNILPGTNYKVNVKLFGNSSANLGIINSVKAENVSKLTANKLKPSVTNVDLGVIKIMPDANYATVSKDGVYTPSINLAYNYNDAGAKNFWNTTAIYKILVKSNVGETAIYAVDYYSVITAINNGVLTADDYILMNGAYGLHSCLKYKYMNAAHEEILYFNVYQENEFNLRDYDELYYYLITETVDYGKSVFDCSEEHQLLDLSKGASFSVDICMLGGESVVLDEALQTYFGYLTSQPKSSKTFIRYGDNKLTTLDGKIRFDNLVVLADGKEVDYPVHKFVAGLPGGGGERTFYFYHTTEEDAKIIAARNDPSTYLNAIYLKAEIDEKTNTIVFDMSQYFEAGTYVATIRTLAGLGSGVGDEADYLLNALDKSQDDFFHKLSDSVVVFNEREGLMEFAQSYIVKDSKKVYSEDYEISLLDRSSGTTYVYNINGESEGITIDNDRHVVKYVLPRSLSVLTKEGNATIVSEGGQEFSIKVCALAVDSGVLNGTYKKQEGQDVEFTFEKSTGISDLKIENGILKWVMQDPNCNDTIIHVSFLDENRKTQHVEFSVEGLTSYQFTDDRYDLTTSGSVQIKDKILYSGEYEPRYVNYTITVCSKGVIANGKNILNSNYSSGISTTRLTTVDASRIRTENGILTWDSIEGAASYEVYLKGTENYMFSTVVARLNFLEEGYDIVVGTYDVEIKAIGSTKLNAMMSTIDGAKGFIQLDKVDIYSVQIQENKIVWEAVANADKYQVVFNYLGASEIKTVVDIPEYIVPSETTGKFTINISAISYGEGKEFNGKAMDDPFESSTEKPDQVDKFEFNDSKNRLEIVVKANKFLNGDKLLITYNFAEYISGGIKSQILKEETISFMQIGNFEKLDDETYLYYYPLAAMGQYSSISVQVTRPGTVPSNTVSTKDKDLHLFEYGAGILDNPETEENEYNPYRIKNAEQLLNIQRLPEANYELISSIVMNSVNVAERLSSVGAVIANEFKGTLDGKEFSIHGFNTDELAKTDTIELENVAEFALFKTLKGATIKNLVIGSPNIQLILSNMFASSTSNVVKLSLIATGANTSTLDNIQVLDLKMMIGSSSNAQLSGQMVLTGLIGESSYSVIKNSTVNFSVEVNIATTGEIAVGGMIGKALDTSIADSNITFNIATSYDNMLTYVGGTIAYFEGNEAQSTGISNTHATVTIKNVKSTYVGGLVGFARYIKIEGGSTSGSYSITGINYATYVGGLVGLSQNAIITVGTDEKGKEIHSGSTMTFDVTLTSIENKFFGAIAGSLTVINNINPVSYINNCYMGVDYQEQTTLTTAKITLGICGRKDSSVDILGCYELEN